MPAQAQGDGPAHVEGAALQPEKITAAGFFGIIFHGFGQQTGQHKGHFRVVRGLPGQDVPGTAVFQQTGSIGIAFADGGRGTELHQTAQGIPGDLAHETTGGMVEQGIGMAGHGTSFFFSSQMVGKGLRESLSFSISNGDTRPPFHFAEWSMLTAAVQEILSSSRPTYFF